MPWHELGYEYTSWKMLKNNCKICNQIYVERLNIWSILPSVQLGFFFSPMSGSYLHNFFFLDRKTTEVQTLPSIVINPL